MSPRPTDTSERLRGFAAVSRSLDERGVYYEVVHHDPTGSALAQARVYRVSARRLVKTLALWANGCLLQVALPASERLDMRRVRNLLGDKGARLATESELSRELPDLDAGELPPFGAPAPPLALVDRRVLSCNWVLANGGDERHSVRVSPLEIVRLSSQARLADIVVES
jgi:Ala-tRNA(Pro) deacylase